MRLPVLLALLLLPSMAGCLGGAERNPGVAESAIGPEPETGSRIRVLVITDEYFPIRDAEVYLLELALNSTTDHRGDAFFEGVPAGEWTVHAQHERFLPNRTHIVVLEGQNATARLALNDHPPDLYMIDFRRATGMCAVGARVDGANDAAECVDTPLTPPSAVSFPMESALTWAVVEVEWQAQGPLAETMRFAVRVLEDVRFANGEEAVWAEGTSPVKILIPTDMVTPAMQDRGHRLEVTAYPAAGTPASVEVAQLFEVFVELVYFRPGTHPGAHTHAD